ncbi:MAG: Primosomal protein N' [bacterium ADurb.Bin363]|nr:MAG: Primosomal protein N' [bacterium ADurb.Bin363]
MEKLKENLKSLKDMGLVKVDEDFLPPRARPKVIQVVNLNIEREELFRTIEKLEKSAPKQSCLLKFLIDHNSKFTMTELSKKSDISLSTIRSLREKGYIILKDVEIRRNPLTGNRNFGEHNFTLTQEQQKAFNSISQAINLRKHEVFLLHGITGSGKTEVYLQSISRALELERQAIMLVPEISLTPQTIERFYSRFGDKIALLHSKLSEGERYDEWRRLRDGKASIAIGTRSALFAPLPSVGLIVIDEEHETSYKQESMPPYHAREVSIKRAELNNAVLILGSATPSVEIFYRARQNKISLFSLPFRVEKRNLPSVEVVNMSEELKEGNKTIFSYSLQRSLWECLEKNEKILLFLNRRGHSSFVLCRDCGFVVKCQFCAVSLNYHSDRGTLSCHYCNNQIKLPSFCPNCKSRRIKYFGVGTQKVEMEVNKFFPQARTIRMDSDTTVKKGSHRALLDRFLKEDKTILIGTQMIAKGLDFPEVTLVGIITADTAINLPDFRAGERTFQILTQVSGRAGRGDVPGRVILQTYAPEHPSILAARNHDYKSFYEKEIIERKELSYPPFETIIRVLFTGKDERTVRMTGEELAGSLKDMFTSARGMVLGPCEAPIGKIRENYRWHFILKGEDISYLRNSLRDALNKISINSAVRMSIDVDPLGMM